jgi:hypothetical protein
MSIISLDIFQEHLHSKVKKMCNIVNKNIELEASYGSQKKPITLKKYRDLLKYINIRSSKDKLSVVNSYELDILYSYEEKSSSTYRITISDIDNINDFIQSNVSLKNHSIFSRLIKQYMMFKKLDDIESLKTLKLINKIKHSDKFIALDEYDIRIKLSEENDNFDPSDLSNISNLEEIDHNNITYRLKQRTSLVIDSNKSYQINIDLTDVKTTRSVTDIYSAVSNYELEVDISFKKKIDDKLLEASLNTLANEMFRCEKLLQQSPLLVTKSESVDLIKQLNKLAYDSDTATYKDLPIMNATSVEVIHVLDVIPGNYTVTDKADGERYFLMIFNSQVYLISNNLEVKKIRGSDKKFNGFNNTVLDGENIFIPAYGKYVFLSFDILFYKETDIRQTELLEERFKKMKSVLSDVFDVEYLIGKYEGDYDQKKIYEFHKTNIKNHLKQLNKHLMNKDKYKETNQLVNAKYFIFPMSIGTQYEIYNLSTLLWESYVSNTEYNCPYVLDGMMYTPINQKYTKNQREVKFKILKWKPEKMNSIDFYVEFERNPDTGKIITVYDRTNSNTIDNFLDNKENFKADYVDLEDKVVNSAAYQIIKLHVGQIKNNIERPIPFQPENDMNEAYIYLKYDPETNSYYDPVDIEGNIIQDATVVEFIYDESLPNKFRWIPLRTRYDKTEFMMKYRRKFGNNDEIANRIFNSILQPVKFEDIQNLGNADTNDTQIRSLKTKITSESISVIKRDDKYFQVITNIGKPMRNFHNWIKSNMIYMYCGKQVLLNREEKKMDILDIGVGKGQDLMKFFSARINTAVCLDINEAGLYSGSDGAISRYNVMKKKMPKFPKISFLVADAGQKLDLMNQMKLTKNNEQNKKMLKQIFGDDDKSKSYQTFDVINAQLMLHYLLESKETWNNFCYNVNKYLNKDGYLLITTLDGKAANDAFVNDHITKDYIDSSGEKIVLYDIVKKYSDLDQNLGLQIDVFISIFMERGSYQTEYLVLPSFLINELKTKCNMRLVETETFQNLYYVYEDFFNSTAKYESKQETRKFFNDVKKFYDKTDDLVNDWFEYSKLHRYYVFQKL